MKQSLQLKIGQSLTMTPQLQQAIKLLQLSSLELQGEIQQTLDSNPLLEQEDHLSEVKVKEKTAESEDITNIKTTADTLEQKDRSEQTLPEELAIDTGWEDIYDSNLPSTPVSQGASASFEDFSDLFENQAKPADALIEHLLWQLDCAHLTETDHAIGLAILDGIDERGYLTISSSDSVR
jgi:RNA polymerase sigma-54 factor